VTLQEASSAALEGAQAGDLDALDLALEARCLALAAGESITPGVLSAGELTVQFLRDLIRDARLECARLQQIADGFGPESTPPSHVDLLG
jgi:hypothetical protein